MAIAIFILKLVVSSGLLYTYYYLFLRNQRFHRYNRFYLLTAVLLSLTIPFINIPLGFFAGNRPGQLVQTLRVINVNGWEEPVTIYARNNTWSHWINIQTGLYILYLAGMIASLLALCKSIRYIIRLKKKYHYDIIDRLKIYNTAEPGTPFSFFTSIFWDQNLSLDNPQGQQIFRHEMFHVKEKHSADILLLEILCTICWFNPFFHLAKKELKTIHEFLADEYAVSADNRHEYAELLVLHAMHQKAPAITHPFFHNQIKRRITMITQSNLVRRSGYISRIMALPLLFVLVSAFAVKLTGKPAPGNTNHSEKKLTVVIDAGHGGKYAGVTQAGTVNEKDINLQIAQKIKQLSAAYNVNIILTRNNDQLVGNASNLSEDLQNRIAFANTAKSDLFVSIHVNGNVPESPSTTGFVACVSGKRESMQSKVLASTLLSNLKSIYAVHETILQRQTGVQVLDKTECPSVILECGYITNPTDLAFITDKANQEKIARKILEGIVQYGNMDYNLIGTVSADDHITTVNFERKESPSTDSTIKKIQFTRAISAEELSKLNVDDIKYISADMKKTEGYVFLKDGKINSFHIKEVNEYYTTHHIENPLKGYRVNFDMQDSLVNIRFAKDTVPGNKVFTKVEEEAEYPGGQKSWSNYLFKTIRYPQRAQDKEIKGTVVVQFIVDENGKVSDVKTISGPKELLAESIRVIKESGVWTSALQNGKKVKSYKRQPITYKLERQG